MKTSRRVIRKVLVANRGEIACRVIRACREAGIATVAVYSDLDRSSLHVRMADEAVPLGGRTPGESYLRQETVLSAAAASGADAVHPGYGFLSENPVFAEAAEAAGLTFIGPPGAAIRKLGDKTEARKLAQANGVPTVPGTIQPLRDATEARSVAEGIGYPVLLKAAAGGGGKGMRVVREASELDSALRGAKSEALSAFGDDRVYVEKYLSRPRHVEIQVIADLHGAAVYLGERECSIQRRHQKVVEESPSTALSPETRKSMGEAAVRLVQAAGYRNAGTVEFILDSSGEFYFLEVNTRLQVEHPVTELVTGIDLVREQLSVAAGRPLSFSQDDIHPKGWAIECRICAEDPDNNFFPSTGRITRCDLPSGPFVRVENGFGAGDEISVYYDSLLAKLIVWAPDRPQAIARMTRALQECVIQGVATNISFCRFVVTHPAFREGNINTHFVEEHYTGNEPKSPHDREASALAAALIYRLRGTRNGGPRAIRTDNGMSERWLDQRNENLR